MKATTMASRTSDDRVDIHSAPRFLATGTRNVREVWQYRQLLGLLVRRELKIRYKDSMLGFFWTLIRPLTLFLVYYVAIGKFLGAERSIPSFAIFVFAGLTFWFLFTEIVTSATSSIVGNSGLIRKVYLPRELFPLAGVGVAITNFLVQLAVLVAATLIASQPPDLSQFLIFLPAATLTTLVLATGIGLLTAALNVYLRDVQYLVEIVFLVGFWVSPIVYSWPLVQDTIGSAGWLHNLYLANPLTVLVMCFQKATWSAGGPENYPPDLGLRLAVTALVSLIVLWLGHRVFCRLASNFAQEL